MSKTNLKSAKDGFSDALLKLAQKNKNIVALSADLKESVGLKEFSEELQDQYIECGVAEQNMIGIAAGLALSEKIPFAASFPAFSPGRSFDQIRVSVCLSNLPVKIVGVHAGFSNYKDGASHQCLEDIAITRVLPNLKVVQPADYNQAVLMTKALIKEKSPVYVRLSKEFIKSVTSNKKDFEIGQAQVMQKGEDLVVVSFGPMLSKVLQATKGLTHSVEVINMHTIKPLDTETLMTSLEKTKNIMTVEDHQISGGLGGAVAEFLATRKKNYNLKIVGVKNTFGRSAKSIDDLYNEYNLSVDDIKTHIKSFFK